MPGAESSLESLRALAYRAMATHVHVQGPAGYARVNGQPVGRVALSGVRGGRTLVALTPQLLAPPSPQGARGCARAHVWALFGTAAPTPAVASAGSGCSRASPRGPTSPSGSS